MRPLKKHTIHHRIEFEEDETCVILNFFFDGVVSCVQQCICKRFTLL